MSHGLEAKIALVTGASAGIGLAVAQRLVDEGAFVYLTGRGVDALDAAAAGIGRNARAVTGDVADLGDLDRLVDLIGAEHGRLDIVVANAGTVDVFEATQESEDWWAGETERTGKATVMYTEGKKAKAWFLGESVPGKPEAFLVYMGGGQVNQQHCRELEESGYEAMRAPSRVAEPVT